MKKVIWSILTVPMLAALLLAACATSPVPASVVPITPAPAAVPPVLAVETFLADIAQNVAGDRLKVDALIPIGVDPHAFEPTPRDVTRIAKSQVLIANGAGFEEWLKKVLDNAGGQRQLIEGAAGLASRQAREGEEAVMSPAEKAEAICAEINNTKVEAFRAGPDAAAAAELAHEHEGDAHAHGMELLAVKLTAQADGSFAGYIKLHAEKAGDFVVASHGGTLALTGPDGQAVAAEEVLALTCSGLSTALVIELGAGEYLLQMSGFTGESAPLLFGVAGGHQHDAGDPHFWLDPVSVIKYTENIRDGLIQADPAGKEVYTKNTDTYVAKLRELDTWITEQVKVVPQARRLLVTNHESFGYFADRYGFQIVGTVIPSVSTGASPSAQQLARLVDRLEATSAPAIFLETGANPQLANQLAREIRIKIVTDLYTHSVTESGGNAPTYIDMMHYNVQKIVEALR
jgi:ABC-type Zn uptake system ZnuABC Zn-binding protein ZnuA